MDAGIRLIGEEVEDDPHVEIALTIEVGDGFMAGRLETSIGSQELHEVAGRLRRAPGRDRPTTVWEQGSPRFEDRWWGHNRWAVTPADGRGHCVLAVRLQTHGDATISRSVELALPVVPHDLDRLARELERLAGQGVGSVTWAPAPF